MSESNCQEIILKIIELDNEFTRIRDSLGMNDEDDCQRAIDFEFYLAKWLCAFLGHQMTPDMCGRREHEYCARCHVVREDMFSDAIERSIKGELAPCIR